MTLAEKLTSDFVNPRATTWVTRALYLFFGVKLALSAPALATLLKYKPVTLSSDIFSQTLFLLSSLANAYPYLFVWASCAVIFGSIFLRPNYFSALIIFWISVNMYRIQLPVLNGADLMVTLLLFFNIFLSAYPRFSLETKAGITQVAIYNFALLTCRLQVGFIYLLSGLDKLKSDMWRSGEALAAVGKIDYLVHPNIRIDLSNTTLMVLSWLVILFELLFPILVWIRATRIPLLIAGLVFHIMIWILLSLPDFAAIMIIAYMVFLNDREPVISNR